MGPGVERDLASNAKELGLSVPAELPPLEKRIKDLKIKWEKLSAADIAPLWGEAIGANG